MPSIMVSDEVYRKLEAKASERHSSIEEVVNPYLERIIETPAAVPEGGVLTGDAWWAAQEEMKRAREQRGIVYPPGFEVDCSREAIYFGEEGECPN